MSTISLIINNNGSTCLLIFCSDGRFYLRHQLNAIKEELGSKSSDSGGEDDDIADLQKRIEKANPPPDVMSIAKRELHRLKRVPQASAEHSVIRTYIEVLADIPWSKGT